MTDFEHARKIMVDNQLRTSGITDRRLLAAMGEVPRELFVPAVRRELAYIDEAQPLNATRRMAPPAPFAKLVQLAAIEHTDRVLDLGCGTGYSTAVLARLGAQVVAVEEDAGLAAEARRRLAGLGVGNAQVVEGSFTTAAASAGPYDVIVIEGSMTEVPDAVLAQLKPEGRLVVTIQPKGRPGVANLFARSGKGVAATAAFDARLPPLEHGVDDAFVF
ncbi:MAG TPA: protein-L-isoaspartate O-methyltransferase [Devosia sp.]|nr:protein-L-isoaspartate O-methyltransferase [Devosia sp.]